MDYQFVRLSAEDKVATLALSRPPANLLSIAMVEEINDALLSLRQWESLEVLVLRGAGSTFCDGLDLREHTQKRVQRFVNVFLRTFETLRLINVISVAAVEGRAHGAGFELALGCNLIVSADTADFSVPQIRYGLLPPLAAAILPRVAPRRKAMEWILTGSPISAARLEHDGVINRLFPRERFDGYLHEFIAELTDKSGPVLQLAKRAQYEAYYAAFPDAMAGIQSLYLKELMALDDAREGPRAAREGRKPVWKHS